MQLFILRFDHLTSSSKWFNPYLCICPNEFIWINVESLTKTIYIRNTNKIHTEWNVNELSILHSKILWIFFNTLNRVLYWIFFIYLFERVFNHLIDPLMWTYRFLKTKKKKIKIQTHFSVVLFCTSKSKEWLWNLLFVNCVWAISHIIISPAPQSIQSSVCACELWHLTTLIQVSDAVQVWQKTVALLYNIWTGNSSNTNY